MSENRSHEISDVKPTSLKHLVGQQSVIEQVSVALDAAFADNRKFDHAAARRPARFGQIGSRRRDRPGNGNGLP